MNNESPEGVVHMQVSTIGVDLAKNVFQVHGVDSAGKVVITRQLRRKQVIDFFSKFPRCLVGMEACEPLIIGRVKSPNSVTLCVNVVPSTACVRATPN